MSSRVVYSFSFVSHPHLLPFLPVLLLRHRVQHGVFDTLLSALWASSSACSSSRQLRRPVNLPCPSPSPALQSQATKTFVEKRKTTREFCSSKTSNIQQRYTVGKAIISSALPYINSEPVQQRSLDRRPTTRGCWHCPSLGKLFGREHSWFSRLPEPRLADRNTSCWAYLRLRGFQSAIEDIPSYFRSSF